MLPLHICLFTCDVKHIQAFMGKCEQENLCGNVL